MRVSDCTIGSSLLATSPVPPPRLPIAAVEIVHLPRVIVNTPGWHWRKTIPDYWNLWIGLRGRGMLTVNRVAHAVGPGSAFLFQPGDAIAADQSGAQVVTNFFVHFRPQWLGRPVPLPERVLPVQDIWTLEALARVAADCARSPDALGLEQARHLVMALLAQVWRERHRQPWRDADQAIHHQVRTFESAPPAKFNVTEAAAQAGLSRAHYNRRFRQITGTAPNDFVIRKRIERAGMLLRETTLPIKAIAVSLGYEDTGFFSRQFRRVAGCAPSALRRGDGNV